MQYLILVLNKTSFVLSFSFSWEKRIPHTTIVYFPFNMTTCQMSLITAISNLNFFAINEGKHTLYNLNKSEIESFLITCICLTSFIYNIITRKNELASIHYMHSLIHTTTYVKQLPWFECPLASPRRHIENFQLAHFPRRTSFFVRRILAHCFHRPPLSTTNFIWTMRE